MVRNVVWNVVWNVDSKHLWAPSLERKSSFFSSLCLVLYPREGIDLSWLFSLLLFPPSEVQSLSSWNRCCPIRSLVLVIEPLNHGTIEPAKLRCASLRYPAELPHITRHHSTHTKPTSQTYCTDRRSCLTLCLTLCPMPVAMTTPTSSVAPTPPTPPSFEDFLLLDDAQC
jgi:hypothetical protein